MPETTPTLLVGRALIRISGKDVRGFLQGLVTQDVTGPLPAWSGLLTPQGKALFDFLLWADGEDVLIDCEADAADALVRRLVLYRLRRPITITRIAGSVHWSLQAGKGVPDPRVPELGYRWLEFGAPLPALGMKEADPRWLAHRLSLGVIEGQAELGTDQTLWLECNASELHGVSFAKGCYVGQENTARMHHRSKVNRRLVVAPLGEPDARTRVVYAELGVMVELRRVEALGDVTMPDWLSAAL